MAATRETPNCGCRLCRCLKPSAIWNGHVTFWPLLENPGYRDWLRALGDRQIVMIGYSDSTKDGGYLAACWHLQRVQTELHRGGRPTRREA